MVNVQLKGSVLWNTNTYEKMLMACAELHCSKDPSSPQTTKCQDYGVGLQGLYAFDGYRGRHLKIAHCSWPFTLALCPISFLAVTYLTVHCLTQQPYRVMQAHSTA